MMRMGLQGYGFGAHYVGCTNITRITVPWAAVKELDFSYRIGETLLFSLYIKVNT